MCRSGRRVRERDGIGRGEVGLRGGDGRGRGKGKGTMMWEGGGEGEGWKGDLRG